MAAQTPTAASLVSPLRLQYIIGLKGNVRDNIHYLTESEVLYPAGYNLVAYNTEKKTQRFLPLDNFALPGEYDVHTGIITAMATNLRTKKDKYAKLLAVAERSTPVHPACIRLFDIAKDKFAVKGRPIYVPPSTVKSSEFTCMCFSPDGKYLLAQGGAPDWTLVYLHVERGRVVQTVSITNEPGCTAQQVSFCPSDQSLVCVTGVGILQFFHIEQGELRALPIQGMGRQELQSYPCHLWIGEKCLVANESGDILMFDHAEFVGLLDGSPSSGKAITCMATFAKGFACGTADSMLYVFDRDEKDAQNKYKARKFPVSAAPDLDVGQGYVNSVAVSPSDDYVICTLSSNQAFILGLSTDELLKSEDIAFKPLALPSHTAPISGLDVCLRKPLVVTTSVDSWIRVWNYAQYTLEGSRRFQEVPLSVAFHPSGLHILVGFYDSLKLINILVDELKTYKEFPIKGCVECRFSNGGQYMAVAHGTAVEVFATYTGERILIFSGHKAPVRSIYWMPDDLSVASSSADGATMLWQVAMADGGTVINKNELEGLQVAVNCVVGGSDDKLYTAGSDGHLRTVDETGLSAEVEACCPLTQLAILQPIGPPNKDPFLFAGTSNGVVRFFPLPLELKDAESTLKVLDHKVHSGAITRLRVTYDDAYFFSASEDGCLAIFQLELDKKLAQKRIRHDHPPPPAEEVLVPKPDMMELIQTLKDRQNKVEDLKRNNEMQLQLRDAQYRDKLRDVGDKFNAQLQQDQAALKQLQDETEAALKIFGQTKEQSAVLQLQQLQALKDFNEQKLKEERARLKELERRMKLLREHYMRHLSQTRARFEAEKEAERYKHEEAKQEELERKEAVFAEKAKLQAEFEEIRDLKEDDADLEIEELRAVSERKLRIEKQATIALKEQNGILKGKYSSLREQINSNLDELRKMKEEEAQRYAEIESYSKDINVFKKDIKERESTIGDKVNRIFELRKKNEELEKFKFVLVYKITELKRQIAPREKELKQLSEQVGHMDAELTHYKNDSTFLHLKVKELMQKLHGMEEETQSIAAKHERVDAVNRRMRAELLEAATQVNNHKDLRATLVQLYQKHVSKTVANKSVTAADVHRDFQRERDHYQHGIRQLQYKLQRDLKLQNKDNARMMEENTALINEINELRREMRLLQIEHAEKESAKELPPSSLGRSRSASSALSASQSLPSTMHAAASGTVQRHASAASRQALEAYNETIVALTEQLRSLQDQVLRAPLTTMTAPTSTSPPVDLSASQQLPSLRPASSSSDMTSQRGLSAPVVRQTSASQLPLLVPSHG